MAKTCTARPLAAHALAARLREHFLDARERTTAIGVWVGCFAAGGVVGPLIGGVLLEYFWWGSVFLVAVPMMVLLLVLAPLFLPEYRDPDAARLDIPSAMLATTTVLAMIFGMKHIAIYGPALSAFVAVGASNRTEPSISYSMDDRYDSPTRTSPGSETNTPML